MMMEADAIYTWCFDAAAILLRYLFFAGFAYLIFYGWKMNIFKALKIQKRNPDRQHLRKEVFYSIVTLLIYCATSWMIFQLQRAGYTNIYLDIHQYSLFYFAGSIVSMILLHDAYFYWTHRWMHHKAIFKWVHQTHHLSHNPTPWAAFSFHPFEAIISTGILPLIVFTIPSHPYALFTFLTYMTIMSVMGHLGFELFPLRFRKSALGKWQNSSTNHNLHHQYWRTHYGLYFTFWDRVMKTMGQQTPLRVVKRTTPGQQEIAAENVTSTST
jgi:lathosterol oxidase